MNKNTLITLWFSLFFLGCANAPNKTQLQSTQVENKPINLFMINSEEDLMVEKVVYSTGAVNVGGIVVGGGISGSQIVLEHAESLLEEFYGLVDFKQHKLNLIEAQQQAVQAKPWLNIKSTEKLRHRMDIKRNIGDLDLYVTSNYIFNVSRSKLRVSSEIKIIKTELKGTYGRKTYTKKNVLYKNNFKYESPPVNQIGKSEEEIAEMLAKVKKEFEDKEAEIKSNKELSYNEKRYKISNLKKERRRAARKIEGGRDREDNLKDWKSDGAKKVSKVLETAHSEILKQIEKDFRFN